MKIFAVNGSPRKKKSITDRVLQPFLEGAGDAGAEVEMIYLQGKKIKPCLGCFTCWLKTPGVCVQKDEMADLLEMMGEADIWVLATPLYVCGMSAQLKTFLDRIIPGAEPFIEIRNDHCTHPSRRDEKLKGMVLVSSCGFFELDNFDELVAHVKAFARLGGTPFLGALLRPHGEILPVAEQFWPDKTKAVYEAAREAGKELVREGVISQDLLSEVSRDLMSREEYVKSANAYFQAEIEKNTGEKTG